MAQGRVPHPHQRRPLGSTGQTHRRPGHHLDLGPGPLRRRHEREMRPARGRTRPAAAPGRRVYWVDDQPVPTPQAPAPVSESQKEQTPPEEAYPAPNTGSPIGDALEQNSRAATCAELALRRMESGNPEEAWKAMRTALAQLASQQTILEQLRHDAGQSQK